MVNFLTNVIACGLVLLLFFSFSCASRETMPPAIPETGLDARAREKPDATIRESWENNWEKTLRAAQKEGAVVVYASTVAPAIKEAIPLFKKKYGFPIDLVSGSGAQITPKLLMERANGLFIADILIAGPTNVLGDFKPAGSLAPIESALILPEVLDSKLWYEGKFPWADKEKLVIYLFFFPLAPIGINTDLVKPEEIKSYFDLLSPRWKSKIVVNDSTVGSGTGFGNFSSLIYHKVVDLDFFRQLIRQEPVVLSDQRLQVDWLTRGKYPIALWPGRMPLAEYKNAGAPIALTNAKEGSFLNADGGGLALMNRAPHPSAAKVFINWLLSKEGQLIMQNYLRQQSAREDISTEGLDPLEVRKPGEKYVLQANQIEEYYVQRDKISDMAKEIFGSH